MDVNLFPIEEEDAAKGTWKGLVMRGLFCTSVRGRSRVRSRRGKVSGSCDGF
jgi:hypothetical protein